MQPRDKIKSMAMFIDGGSCEMMKMRDNKMH